MKGAKAVDDASIIELFIARDERAIAEVGAKYGALCRGVAQNQSDCV